MAAPGLLLSILEMRGSWWCVVALTGCYAMPSGPVGPAGDDGDPSLDLGDDGPSVDDGPGSVGGLCDPCTGQGQCGAADNACLRNGSGEQFCSEACDRGRCAAGFRCEDIGAGFPLQCIPDTGSCNRRPDPEDPDVDEGLDPDPIDDPLPEDPEPPPGDCAGTAAECEAWQVINEYRTSHFQDGECNNALEWNDELGRLAHDHQSGPFVGHSSYGYVENVGQAYGVRETAEYIMEYDGGFEDHCASDGSYVMSHHCATMFCNNFTIGVGVYEDGGTTYMTMMFGDANGQESW
jgi:hypothetical protein